MNVTEDVSGVTVRNYPETLSLVPADVRLSYHQNDGDDDYEGLDRFGHTVRSHWWNYDRDDFRVELEYGYDRASNLIYRDDLKADAALAHFDELYTYNNLHRLDDMERGELNSVKDAINTFQYAEAWALDAPGNWDGFQRDDDGDPTFDLDQSRQHNRVNEIDTDDDGNGPDPAAISETAGTAWASPGHDKAGNMTNMPQPDDPASSYTADYDAWNRLIKITDDSTSNVVAEYEYDGLNRRIVKDIDTNKDGTLDTTRHFYYSSQWQVLEVREATTVGNEGQLERQYIHGQRYVDALIGRFRDTTGDGATDETRYFLQDANFDVVATVDTSGTVQERFRFTAYGERTVLDADFSADSDGKSDDEIRFGHQGLYHDPTTGLIVNNERYRHPQLGRFTTRDPINTSLVSPLTKAKREQQRGHSRANGMGRYADGMNLYQMLGSNPVNRLDPSGLQMAPGWPWGMDPSQPPDKGGSNRSYTANASSILSQVKAKLPNRVGKISTPPWPLVLVPYPGGMAEVTISMNGSVRKCCTDSGNIGKMARLSVSITGEASLGYGIGAGNRGLKKMKRPKTGGGSGYRNRKTGRIAPNPKKLKNISKVPSGSVSASSGNLPSCDTTFEAGVILEVGGRTGVGLKVNPNASAFFGTDQPLGFKYEVEVGAGAYAGAELYVSATGWGAGKINLSQN